MSGALRPGWTIGVGSKRAISSPGSARVCKMKEHTERTGKGAEGIRMEQQDIIWQMVA